MILKQRSPAVFFLTVFLLSIPFFLLASPGGRLPFATFLPVSALMTFVPMIAALSLVALKDGPVGAMGLLRRALDLRSIKRLRWLLTAIFFMPVAFGLQYFVIYLFDVALPDVAGVSVTAILAYFLMFLVGAIGEEIGWQGYAFAKLKDRASALNAALVLGVVWALWHVIPFALMGRSGDWIIWQCLNIILMRVIIVWLFVNTGESVFIAVLFHAMSNLVWGAIPAFESTYDPFALVLVLLPVTVGIVVLWGPATLSRFRYGSNP